jgi:hypothetical protein
MYYTFLKSMCVSFKIWELFGDIYLIPENFNQFCLKNNEQTIV